MRKFILLSTCLSLVFSCQSQETFSVEDSMMECFTGQYEKYGIDISKSIDSANSILIDHNVLPNISGKSFMKMLKDIKENNGLPFKPTPELITSLENIKQLPTSIICRDSIYINFDSTTFYNSKLANFIVIFDSIAQRGNISVRMIANDFLNAFNEQDFDHPLYSTFGTLALSNLIKSQNDKGIMSLLPPLTKNASILADTLKTIIEISMIEGDKILVDGNKMEHLDIVKLVEKFLEKNEPSGIVKIVSQRSVSYELYLQVIDDVNLAYDNYYDTKSTVIYELNYKDLTTKQQEKIRSKYPKLISISEPKF